MNNKIKDNSFILNIKQDVLNDINYRVKNSRVSNDFGIKNGNTVLKKLILKI